MKVVSLKELREYVDGIQKALNAVVGFLAEENAIIADIPVPVPEKKARKKRVKKEKAPADGPKGPFDDSPKRRGRTPGSKNKERGPFGEPKLRPGEEPV